LIQSSQVINNFLADPITQNVIAGLIGSAITFTSLKIFVYTKDYFYSKKFYFGGTWNTVYEDNEGLLRIKRYAIAKVVQKGRRISGYTIFGEGEEARKWSLDGSIIADRFLVGTYSIKSRHGEYSIGSFFLERSPTGQELIGYWCGYDPMIGDVNFGKYIFYRRSNPMIQVNVRPALKADTEKIKQLGNKIFGNGYLDNWFLPDPDRRIFDDSICLVATKDANVIGMIYLLITDENPLDKFSKSGFDISNLEKLVSGRNPNGKFPSVFLSLIMVDEEYRRRGVGTSLYAKVFQILSEVNVRDMYSTCWKESPNSAIIPFLEKQGWKSVSSKDKYWYEDSFKKGYQCARCGNPCFCTAVLMNLDLPEGIAKQTFEPG
jgi:GNAT superfamily N-acetyltransferase